MIRYPDNPKPVSLDFLRKLDADPPGTWIGQPKLDGWRRVAWHGDGGWQYISKRESSGNRRPLPLDLQAEFEGLPWPDGLGLDCEWMGPRQVAHIKGDSLHVFDLLMGPVTPGSTRSDWLGDMPFVDRYILLHSLMESGRQSKQVRLVPAWANPGLVDRFMEQTQDPLSEGLVVRRADSKLIGALHRSAENPHWFKVKYRGIKGKE